MNWALAFPWSGSLAIPADSLSVVLRYPFAIGIHAAEVELGASAPLLCGFAEPAQRLGVVLRHPLALVVHEAEVGLGGSVPLLCGFAQFG